MTWLLSILLDIVLRITTKFSMKAYIIASYDVLGIYCVIYCFSPFRGSALYVILTDVLLAVPTFEELAIAFSIVRCAVGC